MVFTSCFVSNEQHCYHHHKVFLTKNITEINCEKGIPLHASGLNTHSSHNNVCASLEVL